MNYAERLKKHEKNKLRVEALKPEFEVLYIEQTNQTFLLVSWGFGDPHVVCQAQSQFVLDYCDVLMSWDNDVTEKGIEFGEERAGFIGRPLYRQVKYTSWFVIKNKDLEEEIATLYEEDNIPEIETIFGGK